MKLNIKGKMSIVRKKGKVLESARVFVFDDLEGCINIFNAHRVVDVVIKLVKKKMGRNYDQVHKEQLIKGVLCILFTSHGNEELVKLFDGIFECVEEFVKNF